MIEILESMQTLNIPTDTGYTRIGNQQLDNNNKFSLFPNPTKEKTLVKLLYPSIEYCTISIVDLLGKIQFEFTIKDEKEISLINLAAGAYIVKLYNKGDLIDSQKLIKIN